MEKYVYTLKEKWQNKIPPSRQLVVATERDHQWLDAATSVRLEIVHFPQHLKGVRLVCWFKMETLLIPLLLLIIKRRQIHNHRGPTRRRYWIQPFLTYCDECGNTNCFLKN